MGEVILTMEGIDKTFPGVHALDNVSLDVRRGEVHALMGENGAGKSTLTKIIAGVHSPTQGEVFFNGDKLSLANPVDALRHGIAMVFTGARHFRH